jgi:hypothetical protein
MIDSDDIGNAALFGGMPLLIIFIILYFVFSVPKIEDCHKSGGVILRIEGVDKCVSKESIREIGK